MITETPTKDALPIELTVNLADINTAPPAQLDAMRKVRVLFEKWFREAEQDKPAPK